MADILHSLQISAPPETVHRLVSTAEGFRQWWAEDVSENAGAVDLGFFNRTTLYRLRPQPSSTPSRIEWSVETGQEWAGTRLNFQLDPAGADTLLRFTHAGWAAPTDYFVSCNTVWGELMFRLKAAAEGAGRGPLFAANALSH